VDRWFKGGVAVCGSLVTFLFGGWSAVLGALLALIVADYVTGFAAAGVEGKLSSAVGFRGIARKVAIVTVVAVAHLVDSAMGTNHVLRDGAIWFYLANELLSITENVGRIGLPLPPILKQAVEVLRGKGGGSVGK